MVNDHPILAAHPPDLCPVSGKRIAPMRGADWVVSALKSLLGVVRGGGF